MPGSTPNSSDTNKSKARLTRSDKDSHDELNRKIISFLQQDGRIPYSTIATKLGLSEGAVRKRVNRLQQSGALKIVAVVDPLALSYDAYTMLGICVTPDCQPEVVAQRLSKCPDVVYAIWVSGPYDLLVEVVFEAKEEFVQFLAEKIYGQTDVQNCDVMNNLKVIKNQYYLKPEIDPEVSGQS